jgi:hypothetical protein
MVVLTFMVSGVSGRRGIVQFVYQSLRTPNPNQRFSRRGAERRNGKPLRLCVRTPEFAPCRRLRLLKKLTRNSRSPKPPNLTIRRLVRDELTLVPFGLPRGGKFPRMSYPKSIALDFLTSAACSLSCFFFLCSPTRTPPRTRSFSNPSNIRKTAPPKSRIPENPRETRSS